MLLSMSAASNFTAPEHRERRALGARVTVREFVGWVLD
jgi:hypothetical protein